MSHRQVYPLFKKGVPVKQILTYPLWIQFVNQTNLQSEVHPTASPQPIKSLEKNFVIQDFVRDNLKATYFNRLTNYLKQYLINSQFKKMATKQKLKNIVALIYPQYLQQFLQRSLEVQCSKLPPKPLSLEEIKVLCLQQTTIWRKT